MVDVIKKRKNGTLQVSVAFHDDDGNPYDKPLTSQEFVEECDINTIIRRHQRNGTVPLPQIEGNYGDFSDITNFQDAMIRIEESNAFFDSLPATLRARFDNDTAKFLDFVDDPQNHSELVDLGLITKSEVVEPVKVPETNVSES